MPRKRAMATLDRSDIGKLIEFSNEGGHHRGVIRSVSHGVYSNVTKGEVDIPRVMVAIYAYRSHEAHWATPETIATISTPEALPAQAVRASTVSKEGT